MFNFPDSEKHISEFRDFSRYIWQKLTSPNIPGFSRIPRLPCVKTSVFSAYIVTYPQMKVAGITILISV